MVNEESHYVLEENKRLKARNRDLEKDLRDCELKNLWMSCGCPTPAEPTLNNRFTIKWGEGI